MEQWLSLLRRERSDHEFLRGRGPLVQAEVGCPDMVAMTQFHYFQAPNKAGHNSAQRISLHDSAAAGAANDYRTSQALDEGGIVTWMFVVVPRPGMSWGKVPKNREIRLHLGTDTLLVKIALGHHRLFQSRRLIRVGEPQD
jgi:hypothetical protein